MLFLLVGSPVLRHGPPELLGLPDDIPRGYALRHSDRSIIRQWNDIRESFVLCLDVGYLSP